MRAGKLTTTVSNAYGVVRGLGFLQAIKEGRLWLRSTCGYFRDKHACRMLVACHIEQRDPINWALCPNLNPLGQFMRMFFPDWALRVHQRCNV